MLRSAFNSTIDKNREVAGGGWETGFRHSARDAAQPGGFDRTSKNPTVGTAMRGMLGNAADIRGITRIAMPATVTSKGQVTIPKLIRDRLGIKPGTKVAFSLDKEGRAFLQAQEAIRPQPSRFERLRGTATSRLSTDEIMALTRGEPA
jgi:antitoxin PrlF